MHNGGKSVDNLPTMQANNFRHQDCESTHEVGQFDLLGARRPNSEYEQLRHDDVADILHQNRVTQIYLVHGSFVGDDILNATYGDVVQQFGVAGTGIPPGIWSWRSRVADRRLRRVIQKGIRRRDLLRRLTAGKRIADAGKTLLIDYDESDDRARRLLGGHAVYTRDEWQTFHIEEVIRRYYQESR